MEVGESLRYDALGRFDNVAVVEHDDFTGYQQVLVETTKDAATGDVTKQLVFTLGHDVIAQTEVDPTSTAEPGSRLYFLYDGHGSTRILTDETAAIAEANGTPQTFHYDPYGNALGFDPAAAATSLLYSGEQFDARIQQQYLRARYDDTATGRFNRLDPFVGNTRDPLSLHKYLYTHGNPINSVDPSGLMRQRGTSTFPLCMLARLCRLVAVTYGAVSGEMSLWLDCLVGK